MTRLHNPDTAIAPCGGRVVGGSRPGIRQAPAFDSLRCAAVVTGIPVRPLSKPA